MDFQIITTTVGEVAAARPEWIGSETFGRAVEACARSCRMMGRDMHVGIGEALQVLLGTAAAEWPGAASERLCSEVDAAIVGAKILTGPEDLARERAAAMAVGTICQLLLPVDRCAARHAPVAVLLGPKLSRLSSHWFGREDRVTATWHDGMQTFAYLHESTPSEEIARRLRPCEKNSHVARIVHWPGWEHAEAVRRHASSFTSCASDVAVDVGLINGAPVVRMQRVWCTCSRCPRQSGTGQWCVWAPKGYELRPCDRGPCPNCDNWTAPATSQAGYVEASGFNAEALRLGETVAWHELSDQSVMEIARYEDYRLRYEFSPGSLGAFLRPLFDEGARRDLGFALAEAAYRNLLPTADELLAAWDLAMARGWAQPEDEQRLTLVDVWALFVPRLRALV